MNNHADLLRSLLPPVSYQTGEPGIAAETAAAGNALDAAQARAAEILDAAFPRSAGDWLPRWERVLGLDGTGKPYQQRLAEVLAKINATGGLSIPYFIRLAEAAGYRISIEEPQPFRAGENRAGDRIAPEDIIWSWRVNVEGNSQQVWLFRAGASAAGGRLSEYADAVIESIFEDLKPAHTWVGFAYGADNA